MSSTSALSMATRMRIMERARAHTHHTHTHTHTHTRDIYTGHTHACVICHMYSRENRPRSKACPWYIEPATISDNLFRKQWNRTLRCEWMNIQGLSNDWVNQKSGLLPTRDSSPRVRDAECKFN